MKQNGHDIQVMSAIVARTLLSKQFGQQYGGDRDLYQALGYKDSINYTDCKNQYLRQDIAKAVIDRPAKSAWSGELLLSQPETPEETPFEKAWRLLDAQHDIRHKFLRADILTCMGRYGALLLGFNDVKTKDDIRKPVSEGKRKLMYIRPLSEESAKVSTINNDPANERYGKPESYTVQLSTPGGDALTINAHHTRIIHITKNKLESEIYGRPELEAVFNRLMDLEKLVGASAEMFWRGARPGYQGKVDSDYQIGEEEMTELKTQIDEYEHNLRRILINEGVDLQALTSQISDPSNHVEVQIQMISAATGIPKRVLVGSERGELSSAQDDKTWNKTIQARREEYCETQIINPFVRIMQKYDILPAGEYEVMWPDLHAAGDKERAEVGRIRAVALKEYASQPIASEIVPPDAFMEYFLGLEMGDIELIKSAVKNSLIEPEFDETEEND